MNNAAAQPQSGLPASAATPDVDLLLAEAQELAKGYALSSGQRSGSSAQAQLGDAQSSASLASQEPQDRELDRFGKLAQARWFPPSPVRSTRSFSPFQEWEGYVDTVDDKEFTVRVVDVKAKDTVPTDIATFSIDDLSEDERALLREGAIVRWVLGFERLSSGQRRRVSELYFRRMPAFSQADFARAKAKALELIESINWDEGA